MAMLKQSVNSSFETPLTHGILHERHIFYSTFSTVTLQHRIAHAESWHLPTSVPVSHFEPRLRHSSCAVYRIAETLLLIAERPEGGHGRIRGEAQGCVQERLSDLAISMKDPFAQPTERRRLGLKSLAVCQTTLPLAVAAVAVMLTNGAR